MPILIFIAAIGFFVNLMVHLSTFLGYNPSQAFMLLGIGIFVVWVPAIIAANVMFRGQPRDAFWKAVTRNVPPWMLGMGIMLFIYAFFNFMFVQYLNRNGHPDILDGVLVLQDHGRVIQKLTAQEFPKHQAYIVRSFTGHFMIFYAAAMMILYACYVEKKRLPNSEE